MAKKPLTLTVITDTHYYSPRIGTRGDAYDHANAKSQKLLNGSREVLDAAFRQIKADTRTDIVLLSGDTTNNGELWSHEEAIEQLRDLKAAGKRVYVITATHDYTPEDWTWGYDGNEKVKIPGVLREDLYEMYREFGPNDAIAVHRESMSYVVQLEEGYRLFAINDDSNHAGKSGVSEELFAWIAEQAADARANDQFMIAMTHHPLIAPSPMYEIIGHGDMMGDYEIRREQFADMGIQFILTGHTHVHDIDKYVSKKGNYLYDIATASTIGYPAPIRTVVFDPEMSMVTTTTDLINEPVNFDMGGQNLQDYLEYQLIGVAKDMIKAAGSNTKKFADMATAISIPKKLSLRIGWLIKLPMKLLNKLKIGTIGNWTRAETGLKKSDYANIKDNSVVDFIADLVLNLYGGKSLYTPDDNEYKITIGLLNIIDSIFKTLHIKVRKLVKVSDTIRGVIEPLLYNNGIPSYDAMMPIMPLYEGDEVGPQPEPAKEADTVKESKKGPFIVAIAILILVLLLPLIICVGLPILLIGYIINAVKYKDIYKS